MTTLRRSGSIEEEWQHRGGVATSRRRGDKIKDFRVRLTRCIAMGTKHQLFSDIVANIKDISETSQTMEKLLQYQIWALQQGEKSETIYPPKVINIKEGSATLEEWQRRNGNINVKWKHQRRISNIGGVAKEEWKYQGEVETSKEDWQHQRRRSSARLLLSTDHHSHQDHCPQQAVPSGILAQGDVQGEESG